MDYTEKTNWGLDDTVFPVDMNRIEQGVADARDGVNISLKTDGSNNADAILTYSSDNNFTDDRQIPDLRTLRNNSLIPNSINSGSITTSGTSNLLSSSISTQMLPWVNPKMNSSRLVDGCSVTGDYWHNEGGDQAWQLWNNDSQASPNSGSYTRLWLPVGKNFHLKSIQVKGCDGIADRGYYCARYANFTFYLNGAVVGTKYCDLPWYTDSNTKWTYDVGDIQYDSIQASVGGNPNSPQQSAGGFKLDGYELVQSATSDNTPVVGKDLYVNFNDYTPNDFYGLNTVTVTGSPTYTNNKFNSNGNTGLKYPITILDTTWCMQAKYKFSNTTSAMTLMGGSVSFGLELIRSSSNTLSLNVGNGGSWSIANALTGIKSNWSISEEYHIRTRFTGIQYLVDWSLDGQNWTNDITLTSSTIMANATSLTFGLGWYVLIGTMDDIYATVGSPTIIPRIINSGGGANFGKDLYVDFSDGTPNDRYGLHIPTIVGGANISFNNNKFNTSVVNSYITYPITTFGTGSWCMQSKVSWSNTNATHYYMGSNNTYGILLYRNSSNNLMLCLSSNNTSWNIANNSVGTKNDWLANTEYYVRVRFDSSVGTYYVDWSSDGVTWTNDIIVVNSATIFATLTTVAFGTGQGLTTNTLTGTLDELAITVGQSEIVKRTLYKKVKFNMSSPISYCNCSKEKKSLSTINDADLTGTLQGATNQLFLGEDGNVDVMPRTMIGKDILFRFDNNASPVYDSYNNIVTTNGNINVFNGKGYFDGKSNIRIDNFRFDGSVNWTLDFRMSSLVNGVAQTLCSIMNGAQIGFLLRKSATNVLNLWISSDTTTWNVASAVVGTTPINAYTGEYHVAVVNDGLSYKVYINGKLDITVTSSARMFSGQSFTNFILGTDTDNVSSPFAGYMDDVRLTNGVARWNTNFLPPVAGSIFPDRFVHVEKKANLSQDIMWDGCVLVNKSTSPSLQYRRQDTSNSLFCVKSGNVDGSSYPDLFSISSKIITTKVGGTYPSLVATKQDGTNFTVSTSSSLDVTSYIDGTYLLAIDDVGGLSTIPMATYQKDLYVDFNDATPNDKYGLHNVQVVGTPTYANNKFNSTAIAGLNYPIKYLGLGKWCVQGKFSFSNTTSAFVIFSNYTVGNYTMTLDRNASNKLGLALGGTNNTTWSITTGTLGTKADWVANTEYYIRLRFTGIQYLVDWSLDGQNWTNDITIASTVAIGYNASNIYFGSVYSAGSLIGTMDELQVTVGNDTCVKRPHYFKQTYESQHKINNTLWLDLTRGAVTVRQFDGTSWQTYNKVPIGEFTIENGLVSNTKTYLYYQTGYPVSNSSWNLYKKVPCGRITTNYVGIINIIQQPTYNLEDKAKTAPNYAEFQNRVWATTYTATEDGWLYIMPYGTATVSTYFVNGYQVGYQYCNYNAQSSLWVSILEGDKYYGTGTAGSVWFVPERGVNQC